MTVKAELFVLPEKTRRDFFEAFVLTPEELEAVGRLPFDVADVCLWYDEASIRERMSPDLPTVSLEDALTRLRGCEGTILFLSDSPDGGERGVLYLRGRAVTDFVAMASAEELANRIRDEWGTADGAPTVAASERILPDTLYVFDTTFEWVVVLTEAWGCRVFGI